MSCLKRVFMACHLGLIAALPASALPLSRWCGLLVKVATMSKLSGDVLREGILGEAALLPWISLSPGLRVELHNDDSGRSGLHAATEVYDCTTCH